MAKPKQEILVERYLRSVSVWTNNPIGDFEEVSRIEGVDNVLICSGNHLHVCVDPRYDISEVADEIEALLTSKVPDIFKE